jgi:hypothetical protein
MAYVRVRVSNSERPDKSGVSVDKRFSHDQWGLDAQKAGGESLICSCDRDKHRFEQL